MSMNLVVLLYLVASVCFIQALKGLSHPTTARRGNVFGMSGMAIALLTTVALILKLIVDDEKKLKINLEDDIVKACLVTQDGKVLREQK